MRECKCLLSNESDVVVVVGEAGYVFYGDFFNFLFLISFVVNLNILEC